jgi:peptidoglycan/xylan/chitin deacetylase (PgdA/CDA1 family)
VIRLGYDLFDEVGFLLFSGQPLEFAPIPTLDIHIRMLREWILQAGIPLLEIPPTPAHHSFIVCLTHDIDFVGIRHHRFDHSMWGFLYRSTIGAVRNLLRGRLSISQLFQSWRAVASLPFVYAGWARDFWEPFEWYLQVEKGLPATYFLIPFKRRPGEKVLGPHASRRATAYDVSDLPVWTEILLKQGCEIGVHGIDAWHSADKGHDELGRVAAVTHESSIGIRVHWLLRDANTPSALERAGYTYDSTFGYNETVGYRAGTSQVYRPLGAQALLELPLHIQDGALFYPKMLDLSEPEAQKRCEALIDTASNFGGVLTLLWHDRSHGPERFWGDFYVNLLQTLRSLDCWSGTAAQVVGWFGKRRQVRFEQVETSGGARTCLRYQGQDIQPPLTVRIYAPVRRRGDRESVREVEYSDIPWNGNSVDALGLQMASGSSAALPDAARCFLS